MTARPARKPLVTVICISYNQAAYIRDALDGFLRQRTDFEIEVIVHDDASTDGTAAIIKQYAKKHPEIFKVVLRQVNQFSRHGVAFLDELFQQARGKYICICEGDDYWTDPTKLQRQADLMEHHPEYGLCFHPIQVTSEDGTADYVYPDPALKKEFTIEKLLIANFIQTNSVMYRKRSSYNNMPSDVTPKDWYNNLYHVQGKEIGFINRIMGVYRRHSGSMWWESDKDVDQIWLRYGLAHLILFAELLKLYGSVPAQVAILYGHIATMLERLARVDDIHHTNLLQEAMKRYPELAEPAVTQLTLKIRQLTNQLDERRMEVAGLDEQRDRAERELVLVKQELTLMQASRIWKIRSKLASILGRG